MAGLIRAGAAALALGCGAAAAEPGRFSADGLAGWEPLRFDGRMPTHYALVPDGGTRVLAAECRNSASGLAWEENVDLARTPVLSWRWRVEGVYAGLDERRRPGDDFPARVYAIHRGGWAVWRTRSLVYVWASTAPAGSDWPNPYTSRAHVVALRSGAAGTGTWHEESRDLAADFRRYFGFDPRTLHGIALMTDCDDHGGAGRARYGDVRLGPR